MDVKKNISLIMRSVLCFLAIWLSSGIWAQSDLVPTPTDFVRREGAFVIGKGQTILVEGTSAGQVDEIFRKQLDDMKLSQSNSEGVVIFQLLSEVGIFSEGYILDVKSDTAKIMASTEAGLFYGKEALLQLIRVGKGRVGACRIQDSPRFAWRGFMLDESRHFFGKEKVMQYLDIMASLHLNIFHWHLTDEPGWRIEIKRYPDLTKIGAVGNWHDADASAAFYTQEDIKDIVSYAAERHIMVIPEIDMPGHATSACRAYPEISGGGEGRWKGFTFHPCKEETFEFISNVLDEDDFFIF